MSVTTALIAAFSAMLLTQAADSERYETASPSGEIVGQVWLNEEGGLRYTVNRQGRPIVAASALSLEVRGAPDMRHGLRVVGVVRSNRDTSWRPVYGERSEIQNSYHELVVDLEVGDSKRGDAAPPLRMQLRKRAYNEGVAICYAIPEQPALAGVHLANERTEFRFTDDHVAWPVYSAQGRYDEVPLSQVKPGCERPLVLRIDEELYVALAEARLVDYARMKLAPLEGAEHALVSRLNGAVEADLPLVTPWRVIIIGSSPGELLENNDLLLNLNDPCAIDDVSWIKPGKVIREVTLTTDGGKACVDFAAERNLQYVEFDAGWYGHEYSDQSDATTVTLDPKRSRGPLDLAAVIRYAEQRDVGV
ncbi:MAG: glycoside hydrolase family 97 N-terminal domain-containing protein, partial [Planctomycetota bacterium]